MARRNSMIGVAIPLPTSSTRSVPLHRSVPSLAISTRSRNHDQRRALPSASRSFRRRKRAGLPQRGTKGWVRNAPAKTPGNASRCFSTNIWSVVGRYLRQHETTSRPAPLIGVAQIPSTAAAKDPLAWTHASLIIRRVDSTFAAARAQVGKSSRPQPTTSSLHETYALTAQSSGLFVALPDTGAAR